MNITQIENNLQKLIKDINKEEFIYNLLLAYGLPKASITRLKKGNYNLIDSTLRLREPQASGLKKYREKTISWKKKLYYKEVFTGDLYSIITELSKTIKHKERFIIVTDFVTFLAIDTKTKDKLDIKLVDLPKYYDFFLPWAGMEKASHQNENPADVKAAQKMAKLFDVIKKDNPSDDPEFIHELNIFLSRLLFCFFAEDTGIFKENQFTNAIDSHTQKDGSDLDFYLNSLFEVLDIPQITRKTVLPDLPVHLNDFPYVNGSLFKNKTRVPKFTRLSRQAMIDSGDLDWSAINPDIFGSMFQAVITTDKRGSLGMHYTSVPNIMKVIEPLFLNDLYEEFEKANGNKKKLDALLNRIYNLKIFDPACGSGNFLIIAYKELRKLEMKIYKKSSTKKLFSQISLSQFYGIEIDDFAHEIAKLALWLTEHQMNVEFKAVFGFSNATLPLQESGRITCGNATRLDWGEVCPKEDGDEIYILGNPPYIGARMQSKEQKEDMKVVFKELKKFKDLDYIACWFYKGAKYIKEINSQLGFVTTNSISQGTQIGILWPNIFKLNIEIQFAHTSFKWKNNAKGNAGITVAIIGLSNNISKNKVIYSNGVAKVVKSINAYLSEASNIVISRQSKPISKLKKMSFGNMPNDGGGLILSEVEKDKLLNENPEASIYVKKLIGSLELIRGSIRYCLWIKNHNIDEALKIPFIAKRISITKEHRLKSKDKGTNKLAERAHQFRDLNETHESSIIIPKVSSERRKYIPISFISHDTIISDLAFAIYDAEPWIMGMLSSRMHMTWMRTVAGRLKTDYRYSSTLVYNTFPFPKISKKQKEEITRSVFRIIEEREKHSEKTLAQLYDPDKMPEGLKEAHNANDIIIERCYRNKPFVSDEERLEWLFGLYEKMVNL